MNRMQPDHDRWREFCDRLAGPGACNFREEGPAKTLAWTCKGGMDKTFARDILLDMGFDAAFVQASLSFFENHGGHCDCEILLNVEASVAARGLVGLA